MRSDMKIGQNKKAEHITLVSGYKKTKHQKADRQYLRRVIRTMEKAMKGPFNQVIRAGLRTQLVGRPL
jgi:hypothetical protein